MSPRGIQQYVLKGAFETLTAYTSNFLAKLSSDTLRLGLECDDGAKIQRTAEVYEEGRWVPRSLGSLSGGQYRRCSLALTLGYRELSREWGSFSASLLVLDEPLTHLDAEGRREVGAVLRDVAKADKEGGTVVVILQDVAAEEMEGGCDEVDSVVKGPEGRSEVILDGG